MYGKESEWEKNKKEREEGGSDESVTLTGTVVMAE